MNDSDSDKVPPAVSENRHIIQALRERFVELLKRLTPEDEPAAVYALALQSSESSSPNTGE